MEIYMMEKTIDVIIPTYHPGREFEQLIERLYKQDCPINKIIIMNTEDALWNKEWDEKYPFLEVHHIPKAEFDHGGTRKKAAGLSEADIMVFMTQDALPADRHLLRNLTAALYDDEQTGAAYARQLPNADCSFVRDLLTIRNSLLSEQKQTFRSMGSKPTFARMCVPPTKRIFLKSWADL